MTRPRRHVQELDLGAPPGPTVDHADYIGGADIGALVPGDEPGRYVNPYKTPLSVWAEKTRRHAFEGNERSEVGNAIERPVVELLYAPRVDAQVEYPGTLISTRLPCVGATPDGIRDRRRDVQCKIVGYRQSHRWGDEIDGPEGVPGEVVLQVHLEAWAVRDVLDLRLDVADVPALFGTELKIYEVPIDWALAADLADLARDFWVTHVEPDLMPEVVAEDGPTLAAMFPRVKHPKLLPPPPEVVALARLYDLERAEIGAATKRRNAIAAQIKAEVGDRLGFEGEGVRVKWYRKGSGDRTDWQALALELRRVALAAGVEPSEIDALVARHQEQTARELDVRTSQERYQ